MSNCVELKPSRTTPNPPAAGQFGMDKPGFELRAYRPAGCPSLEQFEAVLLCKNEARPLRSKS